MERGKVRVRIGADAVLRAWPERLLPTAIHEPLPREGPAYRLPLSGSEPTPVAADSSTHPAGPGHVRLMRPAHRPRLRRCLAHLQCLLLALAMVVAVVVAGGDASALPLAPVQIVAEPVDLADAAAGEDLWLFRYTVSGFDASIAAGLSIFFDDATTSALDPSGLAPAAWDVLVLQPDPALQADGLFDALALFPPGSPSGPLEVAFVWSGVGAPGAQAFALYDGDFATIASGFTTVVPEPGSALLVMAGLACLGLRRRGAV